MKRLFQVVDRSTNKPIAQGQYFESKQAAKLVRDEHTNAKVILGPDHWRYHRANEKIDHTGHDA